MHKKISKTGVLIVNLGTPDSQQTSDVRKYLREFLMDWRVVDYPFLFRWFLVNMIIAPFRAPKSAKEYQKLWEDRGSPLKFYGEDLRDLLQNELGDEYVVKLGMRYQNPSIASSLEELRNENVDSIICIPLFPQYASATNGSVIDKVMEITKEWQVIPTLKFVSNFPDHELFIKAHTEIAQKYLKEKQYDHVLFSYHGVPESQIHKASSQDYCQLGECCNSYNKKNQYCYRAQCFHTSRKIAQALSIPEEKYTVSFQSRLGPVPWIRPYTDDMVKKLAADGHKNVLVFSPAFVADCLETTIEVGETYKEEFEHLSGGHWQLVESLNTHPTWVQCVKELVLQNNVTERLPANRKDPAIPAQTPQEDQDASV